MSASALIANFAITATVTRYGAGSNVLGNYVSGAISTFDVEISVQPLNGRELLNLSEGQRTRNMLKGYCATQLYTAQQTESKKADLLTIEGKYFEVQYTEKWFDQKSSIDPYWKVHLAEVNP